MTALVTGECYALYIFLYGAGNHFLNTAVMAQMDHLRTARLQNAAHNVYSSIMPIKQRGSGNKTNFILTPVSGNTFHTVLYNWDKTKIQF